MVKEPQGSRQSAPAHVPWLCLGPSRFRCYGKSAAQYGFNFRTQPVWEILAVFDDVECASGGVAFVWVFVLNIHVMGFHVSGERVWYFGIIKFGDEEGNSRKLLKKYVFF